MVTADERVHDVCRYNVDGIWGWNVHDGDWIYQVYCHPCTDWVASSADNQHRWRMFDVILQWSGAACALI